MTIDVIMPVMGHDELTLHAVDCIRNAKPTPTTLYIIDNAHSYNLANEFGGCARNEIAYISLPHNIGVNASWNLGLSLSSADLIMFLNNDVILPYFLFSQIEKIFEKYPSVGVVVPNTIESQDAVILAKEPEGAAYLGGIPKREGWCFTLPRLLAKDIGWIPASNENFFGDDWFFQGVARYGLLAAKMQDVPIFHYGSVTVNSTGVIHTLKKERESWNNRK